MAKHCLYEGLGLPFPCAASPVSSAAHPSRISPSSSSRGARPYHCLHAAARASSSLAGSDPDAHRDFRVRHRPPRPVHGLPPVVPDRVMRGFLSASVCIWGTAAGVHAVASTCAGPRCECAEGATWPLRLAVCVLGIAALHVLDVRCYHCNWAFSMNSFPASVPSALRLHARSTSSAVCGATRQRAPTRYVRLLSPASETPV